MVGDLIKLEEENTKLREEIKNLREEQKNLKEYIAKLTTWLNKVEEEEKCDICEEGVETEPLPEVWGITGYTEVWTRKDRI